MTPSIHAVSVRDQAQRVILRDGRTALVTDELWSGLGVFGYRVEIGPWGTTLSPAEHREALAKRADTDTIAIPAPDPGAVVWVRRGGVAVGWVA